MMALSAWLPFALAYLAICLVPGPSVAVVMSQTLAGGRRAAAFCILGDMGASLVLMLLSIFGLGSILAASATLFLIVKWAGVAYMAALGLMMIRDARREPGPGAGIPATARRGLRAGFLTGILNPKGIAFYVAFLAQFIDPDTALAPQLLVMVATVWAILILTLSGYALLAAGAKRTLTSPRAQRRMKYAGGAALLGSSAALAGQRAA